LKEQVYKTFHYKYSKITLRFPSQQGQCTLQLGLVNLVLATKTVAHAKHLARITATNYHPYQQPSYDCISNLPYSQ
jgi:hypothetical protein